MNKVTKLIYFLSSCGFIYCTPTLCHAETNLVANGSFEQPAITVSSVSYPANIDGWLLTEGSSFEIRNSAVGTASEGSQFTELDSTGNSRIQQTINTKSGSDYILSFDYSPRPNLADENTSQIDVSWNGKKLGSSIIGVNTSQDNKWKSYRFTVKGTGADILEFSAGGASDALGGSLDNVSLVPLSIEYITITSMPDISGDEKTDDAVIATKNDEYYVQLIDGVTGKKLKTVKIGTSATIKSIKSITVNDDLNANGYKEIAILINKPNGDSSIELRDSLDLKLVKTIKL